MQFSVVITTYQRLEWLCRSIDSALGQTLDCEVVVVDDCSKDGTYEYMLELCKQMKQRGDSRLVYHRNSVNSGHANAVNTGVKISKGNWIKFLDDDDYLAPNCLEKMAEAIACHPDAVICSCVAAQVDPQGQELSRTAVLGPGKAFYVPQADIHYGMFLELLPFGTPVQVACRRDAFISTGGWDSSLDTNCDDIDSWIRIAQFGDAIFINECLAFRTIWTGAFNAKFSPQLRLDTNILMKEKIYELVDSSHRPHVPAFDSMRDYLKLHWILVAIKNRNLSHVLKMVDISILSLDAWRLLLTAAIARRYNFQNTNIRKLVLID